MNYTMIWISRVAACVLLFAAFSKSGNLTQVNMSWLQTVLLLLTEALLALWVLSCWKIGLSTKIASLLFLLFSCYSFLLIVKRVPLCNCFGNLSTSPEIMLVVDLLFCILLWRIRPNYKNKYSLVGFIFGVAACMFIFLPVSKFMTNPLDGIGTIVGSDSVVVEFDSWVGSAPEILRFLNCGPSTLPIDEDCELVFYYEDCETCKKLISGVLENHNPIPVVFIEGSSVSELDALETPANSYRYCKLTDDYDWFFEAPCVVSLRAGKVTSVSTGLSGY